MKYFGSSRASPRRARYFWLAACPVVAGVIALATLSFGQSAGAATAPVGLGTASSFGVLAGSTVTNTGLTVINGDLGLWPGTSVTGFPPGIVNGTQDITNAVARQAKRDLTTAFNQASIPPPTGPNTSSTIGSGGIQKGPLVPGIYEANSSLEVEGALTLDAQGDPDAVWIFQAPASTLVTDVNSSVVLENGAQACNVFWEVGSSATIETSSVFVGTILALTSITVQHGVTITGRALARNGAVTLDDDTINVPSCAGPSPSPTPTTPTPTATTPTPTATATSPTPTATATRPIPSPTSTRPIPSPTGTRPIPSPTRTRPIPSPTGTRPIPSPTRTRPIPSPTGTSPSTHPAPKPTATSPKPKPKPKPRPKPRPAPVPKPVRTTFPVTG
jgi:Ice-binding-like